MYFWFVHFFSRKNFFFISTSFNTYSHPRILKLLWEEALLFDFLQKKVFNNWLYYFLLPSGVFFSEKLFTEKLTRFFLDLLIWKGHYYIFLNFSDAHSPLFLIFSFFFLIFFSFIFLIQLL